MDTQNTNQQNNTNPNNQYPWEVVGNNFDPITAYNGAGGQGIGGIGPSCGCSGKQGDTNI